MLTPIRGKLLQYIDQIPDPTTRAAMRMVFESGIPMGPYTAAQIAEINSQIAAGTSAYPAGASLIRDEDGALLTLQGVGTGAQFTPGTGGGVVMQPVRNESFTLVPSDSGSIIPVIGTVTATINGESALTAPVEIRRMDAGTLTVVGDGEAIWNPIAQTNWGTLEVTGVLQSIAIFPGSGDAPYSAMKVGVA